MKYCVSPLRPQNWLFWGDPVWDVPLVEREWRVAPNGSSKSKELHRMINFFLAWNCFTQRLPNCTFATLNLKRKAEKCFESGMILDICPKGILFRYVTHIHYALLTLFGFSIAGPNQNVKCQNYFLKILWALSHPNFHLAFERVTKKIKRFNNPISPFWLSHHYREKIKLITFIGPCSLPMFPTVQIPMADATGARNLTKSLKSKPGPSSSLGVGKAMRTKVENKLEATVIAKNLTT